MSIDLFSYENVF